MAEGSMATKREKDNVLADYTAFLTALLPQTVGVMCYDRKGRLFWSWNAPDASGVELTSEYCKSLAAVLKSPLFGFDEDLLFELAHGRGKNSLYRALHQLAETNEVASAALKTIKTLRKRADQLPVYEFDAPLLGVDGGRAKMIARQGQGVE